MRTEVIPGWEAPEASDGITVRLPVEAYRSVPVPGVEGAVMGMCFVPVTELPAQLDKFMAINPRVPSRTKRGVLSGPVVKGILQTLRDEPEQMVLKNQGIYLLVERVEFLRGARNMLRLHFSDPGLHGIINGGHTYAAIREAVETAEDTKELSQAYVRLHIMQGVDADLVPEIAEGLNRSKQVDDPSLMNLQGEFDLIRKALKGTPAEGVVSYHQGESGDVYVTELLVYLSMFDNARFTEIRHPNVLYNRHALGLKHFKEDLEFGPRMLHARIQKLPEILTLVDMVRLLIPAGARKAGFQFGRAKVGGERLGGKAQTGMRLPFLGRSMEYRVPNGWMYPILAAFRANLKQNRNGTLTWRQDLSTMLTDLMPSLVAVCIGEHKATGGRPELVGKREAAYSACYTKAQLYLSRKGLL